MNTGHYLEPMIDDSEQECVFCGDPAEHRLLWTGPGFFDTSQESEHQAGTHYLREIDESVCSECGQLPLDELLNRLA